MLPQDYNGEDQSSQIDDFGQFHVYPSISNFFPFLSTHQDMALYSKSVVMEGYT
jgi:hypothetical protein